MDKKQAIREYGKDRCQEMFNFIDTLSTLYAFPYSEKTLHYFLGALKVFNTADLYHCLKSLEDRVSTFPLKFNEIKTACSEAKKMRVRGEEMRNDQEIVAKEGILMPDRMKDVLKKIEKRMTTGDPTKGIE